ncbi:DUF1989 domain-containing protein [Rhodococcus hoagii]|nr:DUF1989 domain-containing protein [Prescottella equi]
MADTVKVPWQAYLGPGHPLLSDAGRVLATVVAARPDTTTHCAAPPVPPRIGRDTATGPCTRRRPPGGVVHRRRSQARPRPPGPAAVAVLLPRHPVDTDGALVSTGTAGAGAYVDLLLHLPVIVLVANTAHPLDPAPEFRPPRSNSSPGRQPRNSTSSATTIPNTGAPSPTPDAWTALHGAAPLERKDA